MVVLNKVMGIMMTRFTIALGIAATLLTACSEVGGDDSESFDDRLDSARFLNDRVEALSPSRDSAIPDSGSVRFDGIMAVNGDTGFGVSGPTTALIGDATFVANFENSRLTGGATDFFGTVEGGDTRNYDGDLTLSEGRIGEDGDNSAEARVTGRLTGGGRTVGVDTDLEGTFLGNPDVRGLEMLGSGRDSTVAIDGVIVPSSVAAAALRR